MIMKVIPESDDYGYISINKYGHDHYEIFINNNHLADIQLSEKDLDKFIEAVELERLKEIKNDDL